MMKGGNIPRNCAQGPIERLARVGSFHELARQCGRRSKPQLENLPGIPTHFVGGRSRPRRLEGVQDRQSEDGCARRTWMELVLLKKDTGFPRGDDLAVNG